MTKKKKFLIIAFVSVSLLIALIVFLCCCSFDSCFYFKPTLDKVKRNLSEWYNITLPENVKMESYASDIGPSDGEYIAVLSYDGLDENFNSIFSYEEDTKNAKSYFSESHIERMHDIFKNFSIPDFNDNKYGWIVKNSNEENIYWSGTCAVVYFYELDKLAVYIFDL